MQFHFNSVYGVIAFVNHHLYSNLPPAEWDASLLSSGHFAANLSGFGVASSTEANFVKGLEVLEWQERQSDCVPIVFIQAPSSFSDLVAERALVPWQMCG